MKKGIEILFLLIGFVFSTKDCKFVGDNRALRKIGVFRKVGGGDFKLYTSEENLKDDYEQWENHWGMIPYSSHNKLPSNLIHSPVVLVSPPGISHYILYGSTNEEIIGILDQRVRNMFVKWFWKTKEEILADVPYVKHPLALICRIEAEKVHNLTFYSYDFESLPSRKKSNYSICSYRKNFSDDPFALLTSLVEGMFGDGKGENESFEGDSDTDSAYIERTRDIIRGNFDASEDQMIIVSKYESLLKGDKMKMFCKFKDADNSHTRLILEFIPKSGGGYTLDNALIMFPKRREDITSMEFKDIVTSIREIKDEKSCEVMDNVNSFK